MSGVFGPDKISDQTDLPFQILDLVEGVWSDIRAQCRNTRLGYVGGAPQDLKKPTSRIGHTLGDLRAESASP